MIFGKLNLCFVLCGHKENGLPSRAAVSGSVLLLTQRGSNALLTAPSCYVADIFIALVPCCRYFWVDSVSTTTKV